MPCWLWFGLHFDWLLFGYFIRIKRERSVYIVDRGYILVLSISGGYTHGFLFLIDEVKWIFECDF